MVSSLDQISSVIIRRRKKVIYVLFFVLLELDLNDLQLNNH